MNNCDLVKLIETPLESTLEKNRIYKVVGSSGTLVHVGDINGPSHTGFVESKLFKKIHKDDLRKFVQRKIDDAIEAKKKGEEIIKEIEEMKDDEITNPNGVVSLLNLNEDVTLDDVIRVGSSNSPLLSIAEKIDRLFGELRM